MKKIFLTLLAFSFCWACQNPLSVDGEWTKPVPLKKGEFQLFLGEVRLTDNMDISSLVLDGGVTAYGIKKEDKDKDKSKENNK